MAGEYFVKNNVRIIILGDETDASLDSLIDKLGPGADKDLENDLFAFSDVAPPYAGANLTVDLQSAATWLTVREVYVAIAQMERAKQAYGEYLSKVGLKLAEDGVTKQLGAGGIINRLKATPTSRTKSVLVGTDPRDSKQILPSQASIFAFDDYA